VDPVLIAREAHLRNGLNASSSEGLGTLSCRHFARGASTPCTKTWLTLGGGTSAASFSSNSMGENSRCAEVTGIEGMKEVARWLREEVVPEVGLKRAS